MLKLQSLTDVIPDNLSYDDFREALTQYLTSPEIIDYLLKLETIICMSYKTTSYRNDSLWDTIQNKKLKIFAKNKSYVLTSQSAHVMKELFYHETLSLEKQITSGELILLGRAKSPYIIQPANFIIHHPEIVLFNPEHIIMSKMLDSPHEWIATLS
jgi:hypothetical protein